MGGTKKKNYTTYATSGDAFILMNCCKKTYCGTEINGKI